MSSTITGIQVSIYSCGAADANSPIKDLDRAILELPFGGPLRATSTNEVVRLQHAAGGTIIAVPANTAANGTVRMFGGRFVYSSDSRFTKAVTELGGSSYTAIPLHDRDEPQFTSR